MKLASIAAFLFSFFAYADVTVPVPETIGKPLSAFQINGTVGSGQTDSFVLFGCQTDGNARVVQGSCKTFDLHDDPSTKAGKINKSYSIPEGYYCARYSNTHAYFTIQKDKPVTLDLQKIIVPGDRSASFDVFNDYSDKSMQDDMVYRYWLGDESDFLKKCPSKNRNLQAACDALKSGEVARLQDTLVAFTSDGKYSPLGEDGKFQKPMRGQVTDPKAGEFVSVFPGVYGIEFKDPLTGKTEVQLGVRVQ